MVFAAPTVQLIFSSHLTKSKAEKFRVYILQAFESVRGSPVTIEIRCESWKDERAGMNAPLVLAASRAGSSQVHMNPEILSSSGVSMTAHDDISGRVIKDRGWLLTQARLLQFDSAGVGREEIVETEASHRELKGQRRLTEPSQSQSLARSKVPLAHVIQQAEGCTGRNGWSKQNAVSIAEKLEQENMRLEPRSRSMLCWKASRVDRRKVSRLKIRTRKSQALLKFVSCGKCYSRSSREHK